MSAGLAERVVRSERDLTAPVMAPAGVLGVAHGALLRDALAEAAKRRTDLVVDLSLVARVDSSAAGLLVGMDRRLRRQGHRVSLTNPSARVCRDFRLTGLAWLLAGAGE